jgi:hypothetical protein
MASCVIIPPVSGHCADAAEHTCLLLAKAEALQHFVCVPTRERWALRRPDRSAVESRRWAGLDHPVDLHEDGPGQVVRMSWGLHSIEDRGDTGIDP